MAHDRWTVSLTPGEALIAATVAANRQVANREANVVNLQGGPQDKMTTELVGIYGELGVARMLNCYPDLTTNLRRGGSDLLIGSVSVDVKTTRLASGDLRIDERAGKHSDVYVLAVSDWTTITAIGYAVRSLDLKPEYAIAGGWRIPQRDLRPMETLMRLHETRFGSVP